MPKKLDPDVKAMSFSERGQEIMKLRRLISNVVTTEGNHKCHINETELARAIGLCSGEISMDEHTFVEINCRKYFRRKAKEGLVKI